MKRVKWLGILLISAAALGGCGGSTAQSDVIVELKESALNAPQTTEVTRGDMQVAAYYDAQVGPRVEQLTFAEEGAFGEFLVELGDTVKEGDILAVPAMENLEKAIENKEKELENLDKTYEYEKASLENEIAIAKKELENVYSILDTLEYYTTEYTETCKQAGNYDEQRQKLELQLKQLKETYDLERPHCAAELQKLREESEGNLIKAPFDGTIIALASVEYGTALDKNFYYVAVADTSVSYARCLYVSLTVLNQLEKAVFWKDGKEYEAVSIPMDHDYYMATKNNGEDAYSEFLISDPNGEISQGDYGKIKLVMKEKQDVLLLPETAVQSTGGNYYVYKDVDGRHERVSVKVGSTDGINVEILEGLEEGDVVYVQE